MGNLIGNPDIIKKTKTSLKSTSNSKIPNLKIPTKIETNNIENLSNVKKNRISGSIDASN